MQIRRKNVLFYIGELVSNTDARNFQWQENIIQLDLPPVEQSTINSPCPDNPTAKHDLRDLNAQVIQQSWGFVWTQLLLTFAEIHSPLPSSFLLGKSSQFGFFRFRNTSAI